MKKLIWIPLFLCAAAGFCQQIGVSLGSAVFDPSTVINLENASPPKNVCGHAAIQLSDDVRLSFTAGYGFETSDYRIESQSSADGYEKKTRLTGVPLECEIQVSKPFVILSAIRPFIGLGFGYYDYDSETETRSAGVGTKSKNRIKGFAQYFSFGLDYRLGRSISAFCEAKKMGFSGLDATGDYPTASAPSGGFRQSLKSEPGLDDLSLTLGILFHLRPGHESSILEKLR